MQPRIYLLTGAPGSGKSTLLGILSDIPAFRHQVVPKITTRRRRKDDGAEIEPVDHNNAAELPHTPGLLAFVAAHATYYAYDVKRSLLVVRGPLPHDELLEIKKALVDELPMRTRRRALDAVEILARRANIFPKKYDLIYEQYNVRYGLASDDLIALLRDGVSAVAIVNDIRVLREIRAIFGDQAVCIFVYSALDALDLEELQAKRGATDAAGKLDQAQVTRRIEKAKVILRRYFENIALFDHVVINHRRERSELTVQMTGIVRNGADRACEFVVHEELTE